MWFNAACTVGGEIEAAFRLQINDYMGQQTVQLMIEHCETC